MRLCCTYMARYICIIFGRLGAHFAGDIGTTGSAKVAPVPQPLYPRGYFRAPGNSREIRKVDISAGLLPLRTTTTSICHRS